MQLVCTKSMFVSVFQLSLKRLPSPVEGECWTIDDKWELAALLYVCSYIKEHLVKTVKFCVVSCKKESVVFASLVHDRAPNAKRQILLKRVRQRGSRLPRKVKV